MSATAWYPCCASFDGYERGLAGLVVGVEAVGEGEPVVDAVVGRRSRRRASLGLRVLFLAAARPVAPCGRPVRLAALRARLRRPVVPKPLDLDGVRRRGGVRAGPVRESLVRLPSVREPGPTRGARSR